MKKRSAGIGLIAGLTAIGAAQADVGASARVGTTGAGFHVDVPVRPNLRARFGTSSLAHPHHHTADTLDYRMTRSFKGVDALLDWYPANDDGFRFSGGLVYNSGKTDILARPHKAAQGNLYNTAQIEEKTHHRKITPYLGIGWGKAADKRRTWSFSADVGVLLQGAPNTSITSTGCTSPTALCTQLAPGLAREKRALDNETGKYKAHPVIRIGFRYQFG